MKKNFGLIGTIGCFAGDGTGEAEKSGVTAPRNVLLMSNNE